MTLSDYATGDESWKSKGPAEFINQYDPEGRLLKIDVKYRDENYTLAEFEYDDEGRRVKEIRHERGSHYSSVETEYWYKDGNAIVERRNYDDDL